MQSDFKKHVHVRKQVLCILYAMRTEPMQNVPAVTEKSVQLGRFSDYQDIKLLEFDELLSTIE